MASNSIKIVETGNYLNLCNLQQVWGVLDQKKPIKHHCMTVKSVYGNFRTASFPIKLYNSMHFADEENME